MSAPQKNLDPFFHRPHEASSSSGDAPGWERLAPAALVDRAAISPNIRSKRKAVALLGGGTKA